jgi:aerobic carbon-monoxide dehydrogenase large subunit
MEVSPHDLDLSAGHVHVRGDPVALISQREVAERAYFGHDDLPADTSPGLEVSTRFKAPAPFTFSNATHVCILEIDRETGQVKVLRYVVSEDCGPMINPAVVEGQIADGVAQGIGATLYENMLHDDDGNPITSTFADYLLPSTAEMPDIEYGHIKTPAPSGGFKGMGEGGVIGAPAATSNAIADALAQIGISRVENTYFSPTVIADLPASAER